MTEWLFDTLVYSGLLIALVLLMRRSVARLFGPQIAYALWLLPFLRLLLPPIVLPASMGPQVLPPVAAELPVAALDVGTAPADAVAEPAWDLASVVPYVVALWLIGGAILLAWRTMSYRRMRREVLADARNVGEVGRIRLIESPVVDAPVAFGVRDKVVALPLLYMAQPDRAARDLAIAHELEHHRGWDLVANFAAQALLALHWFNPVAWIGWRAMRRDQEAACDARVLTGRGRDERALYANLIVSIAAGPRANSLSGALAAPIACPGLGGKNIIHRLRCLNMTDVSPRRRAVGRFLLAGSALALPLTASFSYAAASAQDVPVPPTAPVPPASVVPPDPPVPPVPPVPPAPSSANERRIERIIMLAPGEAAPSGVRQLHRDEDVPATGEAPRERREYRFVTEGDPDSPEFRAQMEKVRKEMEKLRAEWGDKGVALREQQFAIAEAQRTIPEIVESCDNDRAVTETNLPGGRKRIVICHRAIQGKALDGLRRARDKVAGDTRLSEETRRQVLEDLNGEIANLERGED